MADAPARDPRGGWDAGALDVIGVYLRRRTDFKILGSTLDALTARGMDWMWIIDADGKEDPQTGDFIRWRDHPRTNNLTGMTCMLAADASYIPPFSCPVVTIPYFWDNRFTPQLRGRIVCYTSERHLRCVQRLQPGTPDGPLVGWTESDAWTLLQRVPRPEAVLYTLKYRMPEPWRQSWRGRAWYRETCHMIVEEYVHRGWLPIIKAREKNADPRWLRVLSQFYYLDDAFYPSRSWQLLAGAQEITHFVSGVAWEAMVAGVPHRAMRVPIGALADYPGRREIEPAFDGTVSREQFLSDWILPVDGKAGERVADVIAAQV